jgi:PAS domain S-box-containing protein
MNSTTVTPVRGTSEPGEDEQFHVLADALPQVVWRADPDGVCRFVNARWIAYTGLTLEKTIAPGGLESVVHLDDYSGMMEQFAAARSAKAPYEAEIRIRGIASGCYRWFLLRSVPIKDAGGDIVAWIGTSTDIDDLKRTEAALLESEAMLRSVTDTARVGLVIVDEDRRYQYGNRAYAEILGIAHERIVGQRVADVLAPVYEDQIRPRLDRAFSGERVTYDLTIPPREGGAADPRCFSVSYEPQTDASGARRVVVVIVEFTERRRAEEALRENEERLRLFIEHAPAAIAMFDLRMRYLAASHRWLVDYGLGERDLIGRSHYEILPDIPARWTEAHRRALAGEVVREDEDRFEAADGGVRWLRWEVRPWRNAAGDVGGIVIATEDITARIQAAEELRRQEQRYRLLVEANPIGIVHSTADGAVQFCNRAYSRITGYSKEDFDSGRVGWVAITPPEWLAADREHVAEARARGECTPYEKEYLRKDGSRVPVLIGYAMFGERGDEAIAFVMNLSAQKRAEEDFRTLADNIPQLAWMADATGWISWYNRRWYEYTGTTQEQMEGWGWRSVHDPEVLPLVLERWNASIASGEPFDMVLPLRGADGVFRPFLTRVMPVHDDAGRIVRWFGTNTDVSERVEADRRKDEFLAMLAHELRNPLASINFAAQSLNGRATREDLEQARDVVERQVKHLARLIDDLLDVARVTRGTIRLRKELVDVAPIVTRAVETARPLIAARKQRLTTSVTPGASWLEADPIRLEQILWNLLDNAAKYTEEGGQIRVSVERQDPDVVIRVRDTGMGIAPEDLPRIFELFAQGDRSLARSEGGLGIGLTLVRVLAELHGGSVSAQSDGYGTGSEFLVRLPAEEPPPAGAGPSESTEAIRGGMRVLVVDDNEDYVRGLVDVLELLDLDVRTAGDGVSALEAARSFRPEVVLLDIGLPGLDGYQVARRLRAQDCGKDARIIAITGYGSEEDRLRSREAGFDLHLVKPVDFQALVTLLAETS